MGVPPLRLTQQIHLARLHFRWSHVYTDTIPGTLYKISMSHLHNLPEEAIEKKMRQAKTHMDPQLGPHYRLPPPVQQAKLVYYHMAYFRVHSLAVVTYFSRSVL